MFAIHYLKKMAASFFTDRNSNRKQMSKKGGCNTRRVKNRPFREARYGSTRKKDGTIYNMIKRSSKKKKQEHSKRIKSVKNELYSTMVNETFQPTNLLEGNISTLDTRPTSKKSPLKVVERSLESDYSKVPLQITKNNLLNKVFLGCNL